MADEYEECDFSGLPRVFCAHCQGHKEEKPSVYGNDDEDEFEIIGRVFDAQFPGHCTIDYDHRIKRGDRVARVQRIDNPMIPVTGVACSACVKVLSHA